MPILKPEIAAYPDDVLVRPRTEQNGSWWVIYTRSRREKELMRALVSLEISFYCPVIPHRYRSPSGRTRTSHIPLFANYVFMCGDGYQRYRSLQTNLISSVTEVCDPERLIADLRQIQRLIEVGLPISVQQRLIPGVKVRVKSGPLSGIEGVVLKREGAEHLFVAVNFLQQGALISLEDYDVEPV